ncbi:galactokinase [Flavisolibacter tropicus]|uniref:Galactokinase n=1 Tax=Flavisolibacter tropicus TaxID=1492898 RepID=A0A172TRC6_9BACT|nr:galactokinase [Flavisolibacter tropicus]ANE49434.1 galactokinase [Flavisolibacter tropicus]
MAGQTLQAELESSFKNRYQKDPLIVRSPGRVNIIGEHTDYNDGFVLPAAIDKNIFVAVSKREDDSINLVSQEFNEELEIRLKDINRSEKQWANYILGVVDQLLKNKYTLSGFNLMIHGDVPIGAGLSSSAAVECATAFALNELFQLQIDKLDMVKMAQKAEHEYAGVKVGIMDMFASMFGKEDSVIRLDCRSLEYKYEPFKLEGIKIVLLNTNVKHSLSTSQYNVRRQQCEQGVELVKKKYPNVINLRDATLAMLDETVAPVDPVIYKRCKYVVEENQRLLDACEALERGDIATLGQKMYGSHKGLSVEYEVSCRELDFLVDKVRNNPNVLGARMMGGGFGGCTINLVKEEAIGELIKELSVAYADTMSRTLTHYIAVINSGTSVVS